MWPFLASLWTQLRQIDLVLGKVHEGVIFCENAKLESDDLVLHNFSHFSRKRKTAVRKIFREK